MTTKIDKEKVMGLSVLLKRAKKKYKDINFLRTNGGSIGGLVVSGKININNGFFINSPIVIRNDFLYNDLLIINPSENYYHKYANINQPAIIKTRSSQGNGADCILTSINRNAKINISNKTIKLESESVGSGNFIISNPKDGIVFSNTNNRADVIFDKEKMRIYKESLFINNKNEKVSERRLFNGFFVYLGDHISVSKSKIINYKVFGISENGVLLFVSFKIETSGPSILIKNIEKNGDEKDSFILQVETVDQLKRIKLSYSGSQGYYNIYYKSEEQTINLPAKKYDDLNYPVIDAYQDPIFSPYITGWNPSFFDKKIFWIDSSKVNMIKKIENEKIEEIFDIAGYASYLKSSTILDQIEYPLFGDGIIFSGRSFLSGNIRYNVNNKKKFSLICACKINRDDEEQSDKSLNFITIGDREMGGEDFLAFPTVGYAKNWGFQTNYGHKSFGGESENGKHILIYHFNGTGDSYAFINGITTDFRQDYSFELNTDMYIGIEPQQNRYRPIDLYELILTTGDLYGEEAELFAGYFKHKWNIDKLLPSHNFYSVEPKILITGEFNEI